MHKRSVLNQTTEKLRSIHALRLLDHTVLRPQRDLDSLNPCFFPFGMFGQFLSSGQSLCVPAGVGSICPAAWFRPAYAQFEL